MKRLEDLPRIAEESLAGLEAGPELRARILSAGQGGVKRLEELPQIAEETLGGLRAGPELRTRIRAGRERRERPRAWRFAVPALAAATVLAVVLPFALRGGSGRPAPDAAVVATEGGTTSFTAGGGRVGNETANLEPGKSSLSVTRSNASGRHGIWDGDSMIRVDGRYYRKLRGVNPDRSALGGVVATTQEYTQDLTLSAAGCTSNAVPVGTPVYGVAGMSGTLVACDVGGLQLYQRVSYNNTGLQNHEGFGDVMQLRGHVVAMSLSNVGLVEGDTAAGLFGILAGNATYEGAGSVTQRQVLIIELDNGAAVQMDVNGDRLGACGVWSCPEFIEAFGNAVR